MSSNLLSILGQTLCELGTEKEDISLIEYGPSLSRAVRALVHTLLWHPFTLVIIIMHHAWTVFAGAPPVVQLLLLYIICRRVIFRGIERAVQDYQAYLDLGRGGSPCNLWGWWRTTRLKFMAAIDVHEAPHVPPLLDPYRGILWRLPPRKGMRPLVRGIAPQRQINQKAHVDTFKALQKMIADLVISYPDDLCIETSFLEGHTCALKLRHKADIGVPGTAGEFGYEICHPHTADGSLHMVLHPEDICNVIESGWGERHPLATNTWYWWLWYHCIRQKRRPVPEYLVLVYAPRTEEELHQVHLLIRAAVWFATKGTIDLDQGAGNDCKTRMLNLCSPLFIRENSAPASPSPRVLGIAAQERYSVSISQAQPEMQVR